MFDVIIVSADPAGLTAATNTSHRGLKSLRAHRFPVRRDGLIKVDENFQTNIEGIFTAGDVTGEIRLVATVCAEEITVAVHAFENIKKALLAVTQI